MAKLKTATPFKHRTLLQAIACSDPLEVKKLLRTSSRGLSEGEAQNRLKSAGRNDTDSERVRWWTPFIGSLKNRFNLLVLTLAFVSYLTHDLKGAVVMAVMVALAVALTFFQEYRSSRAAEKLKGMVSTRVTVTRTRSSFPVKQDIPLSEVVPGDLIHLSAGDIVPGDLKLFTAKDLFLNQSTLTGESLPVEKQAQADPASEESLFDCKSLCFQGSNVVSGTATGFIVKTGKQSYLGSIASRMSGSRPPTSFDVGVTRFTSLLLKFMLVMVPLVFLINGYLKGDWSQAFLFAIAVAIGLTPEMLPMIVTVNLAKGAMAMAGRKVIVKRLGAIQNFGAMDILCTDKTGTLTEDEVVFHHAVDPSGETAPRVMQLGYLNSAHQTGLKNFLDLALVKQGTAQGLIASDYLLLDELPFDFSRKRMSVLVQSVNQQPLLICKGSVEEVLHICHLIERGKNAQVFTETFLQECQAIANRLNDEGERVIAVAYKLFPKDKLVCQLSDEADLTFAGFLAFSDPPVKLTARKAISDLRRAGVQIKIVTGDNARVTQRVAEAVGLSSEAVITGPEIEKMSAEQLGAAVHTSALFVKLTPDHKQRIVDAFHSRGHVVGFLGDGVNDALALRSADVGISVNNAVDIAKESADIILLQKDLDVLIAGVIEGRKVFANILKYIRMGASSNFGNVFSVLGASCLLPFLPMLPVHMLIQNLLYDFSQTTIPFDRVDPEYLLRPRRWEIGDIGRFMIFLGPISSIFDYLTFALLWYVFSANSVATQGLFQAGWFIEGLLSQTLIVHIIRTRKVPFFQSRPAAILIISTLVVMAAGLWFPYSRLGLGLGFLPPPPAFFPFLILILIGYCFLAHFAKTWFYKKYGDR